LTINARSPLPEWLDRADLDPLELAGNLRDIRRLNHLTGTTRAVCRAVFELIGVADHLTILDVGSGAADFPAALTQLAQKRNRHIQMIAADRHNGVLNFARQTNHGLPLVQLDGVCLPIADGAVDGVVCVQVLHHLAPDQVRVCLTEFARVSRIGFVLLDLDRNRFAAPSIGLLTGLLSRNRLTRADGPQSARRAYRPSEILALAAANGLCLQMRSLFPFRWVACWKNPG
jgi:SAM-dependent methyltransferase